jgi:hypothetical protein
MPPSGGGMFERGHMERQEAREWEGAGFALL